MCNCTSGNTSDVLPDDRIVAEMREHPDREYPGLTTWPSRPDVRHPGSARSILDDVLIDVVAPSAFEGSQIEPGLGRLDARQNHLGPALGAGLRVLFDGLVG